MSKRKQTTHKESLITHKKAEKDSAGTFIVILALILFACITAPCNLFSYAINAQSILPVPTQILWTSFAAILTMTCSLLRNKIRLPKATPWVLATFFIISFLIFRTSCPSLLNEGETGARPYNGWITWQNFPDAGSGRLQDVINLSISKIAPETIKFKYSHSIRFDNYPINNASIVKNLLFGILIVLNVTLASFKTSLQTSTRVAIQIFLLSSFAMMNAYGHFRSFIVSIFCILMWFLALVNLDKDTSLKRSYALLVVSLFFACWAHPFLVTLVIYSSGYMVLLFFQRKNVMVHRALILIAGLAIGFIPLLSSLNPLFKPPIEFTSLTDRVVFDFSYLCKSANACFESSLPAIILAVFIFLRQREALKKPSPLQLISIVMLVSNVVVFFTSDLESAMAANLASSMFGAMIYGSVIILFYTLKPDPRPLLYAAILGLYIFVPTIYIHTNTLAADRMLKIYPMDKTAPVHYGQSPYVKLGLSTPIYTKQEQENRLCVFRAGFTNDIPEWQKFKTLNLLYYIAWCFEFGEIGEGSQWLIKVFNEPSILQDLWRNGTRFTDRGENLAYRRIRDVSRQIINANIQRDPSNNYLKQLSAMLDEYEQKNP